MTNLRSKARICSELKLNESQDNRYILMMWSVAEEPLHVYLISISSFCDFLEMCTHITHIASAIRSGVNCTTYRKPDMMSMLNNKSIVNMELFAIDYTFLVYDTWFLKRKTCLAYLKLSPNVELER